MCAGHKKPVCGSDGRQYTSHCQLHRAACISRQHIRIDRRGACFAEEVLQKEKSWLMEEERLIKENREPTNVQEEEDEVTIDHHEIIQFPNNLKSESRTADIKKSFITDDTSADTEDFTSDETVDDTTHVTEDEDDEEEDNETQEEKICTWQRMNEFKEALLMYRCKKFDEPNCHVEVETDRQYLAMLIFSNYDTDIDFVLTKEELMKKEEEENFSRDVTEFCHLIDLFKFMDTDTDGRITVSEFSDSFKMKKSTWKEPFHVSVVSTVASVGNGLELKCGVEADQVVWKRYNTPLSEDTLDHEVMVFEDGSLYFSTIALHHIGNYTCLDAENTQRAQVHQLRVHTMPLVTVSPVTQTHERGSDFQLFCVARGVPQPTLQWSKGQELLQSGPRTVIYYDGGHFTVHDANDDEDSGSYTCSAHNQAGTTEKSVSVTIIEPNSHFRLMSVQDEGTFLVFHSNGVTSYKPSDCLKRQVVHPDFNEFKFKPIDAPKEPSLCPHGKCNWSGAVRVGANYIYALQPKQNRVVIFTGLTSLNPIEVVSTDRTPRKLWYVSNLDQVWVLCGDQDEKMIEVISDARQPGHHRAVHTQPVGNHFDTVEDLFIAPHNDLGHEFAFGYVSHTGRNNLLKLGLEDMTYTNAIDLSSYNCHPKSLAFVPIGGHVIIECVSDHEENNLQVVLDHLTDTVLSAISLPGRPMVSPDSRHMITVDDRTGKVVVSSVSDEGVMERTYEA